MPANQKNRVPDTRQVVECLNAWGDAQTLDGAGIGAVAKAALSDFVRGTTAAAATREVTRLLAVMVKARHLELTESNRNAAGVYYV